MGANRRPVTLHRWIVAAWLVITLIGLLMVFGRFGRSSSHQRWGLEAGTPVGRLVDAVSRDAMRSVQGRLSGGFRYQPLEPALRSGSSNEIGDDLSMATIEIEQATQRTPNTRNMHAWGVAQILLRNYDAAIATLEKVAEGARANADVRNDLAVVYMERARRFDRVEDWPRAMENAERASQLDASCRECAFNRALIADAMGLQQEALRLWSAYLTQDQGSGWRVEGQRHMDQLRTARTPALTRTRGSRQIARERAEDGLLPAWGAAVLGHRTKEASELLAEIRAIGIAMVPHDRSLQAAVDEIEGLTDTEASTRLARGYVAFGVARKQYEANAIADAVPTFAEAKRLFVGPAHPFALWARLYIAIAAYYRGERETARQEFASLETTARANGYAIVAARAAWMRGLLANLDSDFQDALANFARAADTFERAGEIYNLAAVQNILANIFLYVGSQHEVWRNTLAALRASRDDPSYRRRHTQLLTAEHECQRSGFADAALVFQREALGLDTEWRDPAALAETHNYRARSLISLGRAAEATQAVSLARTSMQAVRDLLLRHRLEAEIRQTEVDLLLQTEPRRGIEAASEAITYFAQTKTAVRLSRLYLARGRAWEALGDHTRSIEDFDRAARQFEIERQSLPPSEALRLSHTDELWDTFKLLVEASYDNHASCSDLLAAAERGRALTLREDRSVSRATPPTLPVLSADERIVHYTFLRDRLLVLTLSESGCNVDTVPVTERRIQQLAMAWRQELAEAVGLSLSAPSGQPANGQSLTGQSPNGQPTSGQSPSGQSPSGQPANGEPLSAATRQGQSAGQELFDLLLAPVWPRVRNAQRLGIVADGSIHEVPFAALPVGRDQVLIDDMDVRLLPTLALRSSGGGRPHPSRTRGLAVVTGGGASEAEALPTLPAASREAAAITQMLTAAGLTLSTEPKERLLEQLGHATVFHFAGHAVANTAFPLLSHLVLGGTRDPWLTASAIAGSRMDKLQLVVLSACETASGQTFGGDGPASLARAFLSAGATQVVATLWPVKDEETARFATTFYQQWLRHRDAPSALREAMRAEARTRHRDWTAWVAVTSY